MLLLVIRSVTDILVAQSRFVKFVGGEAAGLFMKRFRNVTGNAPFTNMLYTSNLSGIKHLKFYEHMSLYVAANISYFF